MHVDSGQQTVESGFRQATPFIAVVGLPTYTAAQANSSQSSVDLFCDLLSNLTTFSRTFISVSINQSAALQTV